MRGGDGRPASDARQPRDGGASWASTPSVRRRMQLQATRNTAPELALRRILHSWGLRYLVDRAPLPEVRRRADLVFRGAKVAVFVDGCFWHGCPDHGVAPRNNAAWWADKLESNQLRDRNTDDHLERLGWLVIRVWEHQDAGEVAESVAEAVRRSAERGVSPRPTPC